MNEFRKLLDALDQGIVQLQERACFLQEMAEHVCNRRLARLEQVVDQEPGFRRAERELTETVRGRCEALAGARGLEPGPHTLREIISAVSDDEAIQLQDRRQRLVFAVDQVHEKARHLMRIADRCRDVEERVILAVLGGQEDGKTYCRDGAVERDHQGFALQQKV